MKTLFKINLKHLPLLLSSFLIISCFNKEKTDEELLEKDKIELEENSPGLVIANHMEAIQPRKKVAIPKDGEQITIK